MSAVYGFLGGVAGALVVLAVATLVGVRVARAKLSQALGGLSGGLAFPPTTTSSSSSASPAAEPVYGGTLDEQALTIGGAPDDK